MQTNVDDYFIDGCGRCDYHATPQCKVRKWPGELEQLRRIALDCGLTEEAKWGAPCYTFQGKNILMVSALKDFSCIGFFKGSLLKDDQGVLTKPGKNSQAMRQVRFTSVKDILESETTVKACIYEAIEVEKAGLNVEFKKNPEPIPGEFQNRLDKDPVLKAAFEALTPGRQRGYILHFSQPKQSKTRESRIEKCVPKILTGKGFHDR